MDGIDPRPPADAQLLGLTSGPPHQSNTKAALPAVEQADLMMTMVHIVLDDFALLESWVCARCGISAENWCLNMESGECIHA